MDISTLFDAFIDAQDAGKEFPIVGPLREPTGILVRVCGPDSDRQSAARSKVINRRLWRQRMNHHENALSREQDDVELVASAIMDWSGIEKDGQPFPYSPKNAEYLVSSYRIFRDQIDVFSSARGLFAPDDTEV